MTTPNPNDPNRKLDPHLDSKETVSRRVESSTTGDRVATTQRTTTGSTAVQADNSGSGWWKWLLGILVALLLLWLLWSLFSNNDNNTSTVNTTATTTAATKSVEETGAVEDGAATGDAATDADSDANDGAADVTVTETKIVEEEAVDTLAPSGDAAPATN